MILKNSFLCLLIMGLPGSGKTTIGKLLSKELKANFIDSDNHHSMKNIDKMKNGFPLNDFDRHDWLLSIKKKANQNLKNQNVIIACSALKKKYRDFLSSLNFKLVYLKIDHDTAVKRIINRNNHFMPISLLKSQIEILEEPKKALIIDANFKANKIKKIIINHISKTS